MLQLAHIEPYHNTKQPCMGLGTVTISPSLLQFAIHIQFISCLTIALLIILPYFHMPMHTYVCTSVLPSFHHTYLAWTMQQNTTGPIYFGGGGGFMAYQARCAQIATPGRTEHEPLTRHSSHLAIPYTTCRALMSSY